MDQHHTCDVTDPLKLFILDIDVADILSDEDTGKCPSDTRGDIDGLAFVSECEVTFDVGNDEVSCECS
jgi:hypothetical protein